MSLALSGNLEAPSGKFRVVAVDRLRGLGKDRLVGDYPTLQEAREAAEQHAGVMQPCYVYDDEGRLVYEQEANDVE